MLELTCIYKELWNGSTHEKRFDSFGVFGKWVADNATEIAILDVIEEEEYVGADDVRYIKIYISRFLALVRNSTNYYSNI